MEKELLLPEVIKDVVKNSNITDLTEAEKIAANYAPLMNEVTEQGNIIKSLEKGNPDHLEKARRANINLGKICSRATDRKATDKQIILLKGRFVDALFNSVNGAARLNQVEAKEIINHAAIIEKERTDKLQIDRQIELGKYTNEGDVMPAFLGTMETNVWDNYLTGAKTNYEARIAAEKAAEELRIETERIEKLSNERYMILIPYSDFFDAEDKELILSDKLGSISDTDYVSLSSKLKIKKIDFNKEQEKIRLENERLKEEADEKEAQRLAEEKERQRLAKIEADKLAEIERQREIEADKQRKIQQQKIDESNAKAVKLAKELQDKKDAEIKAENDRIAAIEAEANKGDAVKVQDLINDLAALKTKYSFTSKKNQVKYVRVGLLIDKVIEDIKK